MRTEHVGRMRGWAWLYTASTQKTLKRGKWGGGKQGNLELLNSTGWEGREDASLLLLCSACQLEQAAGTHCWGALLGTPCCFPWCAGSSSVSGCCFFHTAELRKTTFLMPKHEPSLNMRWLWSCRWLEGWETKTAVQRAQLGFSSSKTTFRFQGRYFISANILPVKTTSLLLIAELSTTSSVTWLPFSPSKCQTLSSLLTHPVPAF